MNDFITFCLTACAHMNYVFRFSYHLKCIIIFPSSRNYLIECRYILKRNEHVVRRRLFLSLMQQRNCANCASVYPDYAVQSMCLTMTMCVIKWHFLSMLQSSIKMALGKPVLRFHLANRNENITVTLFTSTLHCTIPTPFLMKWLFAILNFVSFTKHSNNIHGESLPR